MLSPAMHLLPVEAWALDRALSAERTTLQEVLDDDGPEALEGHLQPSEVTEVLERLPRRTLLVRPWLPEVIRHAVAATVVDGIRDPEQDKRQEAIRIGRSLLSVLDRLEEAPALRAA